MYGSLNHPLAGLPDQQMGGMGAWYDSITESLQSTGDDLKSWYTDIVGEDVAAVTDQLADQAYKAELEKQKQQLTEQLAKELQNITGGGGSSQSSTGGSGVVTQVQQTANQIAASVPGGYMTIAGIGVVALVLLMRR